MFKTKIIITTTLIITFLILTSIVKNKTRVLEKQIINLNSTIALKEKNINEAQLDFNYLTSPAEIEKWIVKISFEDYQPIKFSKIFLNIDEFINIETQQSNLKNLNEKKTEKKFR